MAAGDVDAAADLVEELSVPAYHQGRRTTPLRWFRWLDDRGVMEAHPMAAVQAALVSAATGRAADAERWADAVDRWQRGDTARAGDPATETWAAFLRSFMCRDGVEQMRADAGEAVRGFAVQNIVEPGAVLYQGLARLCCGDPYGADASFQEAAGFGEQSGTYDETLAVALSERSLLAMARHQWQQARILADQAATVTRRTRLEEPIVYAVLARAAMHRGDATSARQQLVSAQGLRSELTYAAPVIAVQFRIELTRVHLALADLAGARTLMREADELLRRRPGLGTLADEAGALRARLAQQRGSSVPGGIGADRRRATHPAAAVDPSVVRRDRRGAVRITQHRQDACGLDLPQAQCRHPQPGGQPGP
jgi:LuxR family transcriptional regulator, maltose regulon positive regulatory protein